ncbi:MAG TPA: hypothetical protein DCG77_21505 [Sphingobacterium sp.]|jgi:hypothetical protein|uniref:Uncharacterized protein n=1 Tax=Sphingobacterium multivorum TaxID=28454 RepID=A0A654DPA4_SPHMU|nr:conserved hypothetical protein [Sphingobacterium multivorum]HAE69711.1 hypothetical protein [Sphingobacterium sp.]HAK29148.1 hypothetical protein [Sphingobacterium sp.]
MNIVSSLCQAGSPDKQVAPKKHVEKKNVCHFQQSLIFMKRFGLIPKPAQPVKQFIIYTLNR